MVFSETRKDAEGIDSNLDRFKDCGKLVHWTRPGSAAEENPANPERKPKLENLRITGGYMRYTLLGTEEGFTICEFCNRKEITMLYRVLDNDTGKIQSFGSTCILKALDIPSEELRCMEAEKALKELKRPYDYTVYRYNFGSEWKTTVHFTIPGELPTTWTRTICNKSSDKDILTWQPFRWTNTATRENRFLEAEIRKEFADYFRKLSRLEKILAT